MMSSFLSILSWSRSLRSSSASYWASQSLRLTSSRSLRIALVASLSLYVSSILSYSVWLSDTSSSISSFCLLFESLSTFSFSTFKLSSSVLTSSHYLRVAKYCSLTLSSSMDLESRSNLYLPSRSFYILILKISWSIGSDILELMWSISFCFVSTIFFMCWIRISYSCSRFFLVVISSTSRFW